MDAYLEPARSVPIAHSCDVLVAGGGPAGVTAAIAAARAGASVTLLETHGCLGGIWTAGSLAWILDAQDKTGILAEILDQLEQRHARQAPQRGAYACDPEAVKLLLEDMCTAAGVRIQLHTRICAAARDGRTLTLALSESKSGRQAWAASCFIDATGDGDLAAQAGCAFELGQPGTGQTQPMSLIALLAGARDAEILPFIHLQGKPWRSDSQALLELLAAQGVHPSYGSPILMRIYPGLYMMMANHQYGVSALDAAQITAATVAARREIHGIVAALRAHAGPWSDLRLVATGEQIGVREGRRIVGRYQVTREDLIAGARHNDAVCRVTFPVDVHALDPARSKDIDHQGIKAQPYDIPLRALIAADLDNLLLAGRCISGDFVAHSSYRVTGNAVAMGEAAGLTAALAARTSRSPSAVDWQEIQKA